MLKRLRSLLRVVASRGAFEAGMTEELRFHIEQYTADLVRSGISPGEAARRARMELGTLTNVKENCREARGIHLMDELLRQLRYAARTLRKSPGFTATALLTLAICLGANLTIFAVIDSVLLRPLPFPDAGRLVTVFNTYPKAGVERDGSSLTNYYERRGRVAAFASLALYRPGTAIAGEAGATEREQINRVTPEFFATLGIGPAIGHAFTEDETTYQTGGVAILTDTYWRRRFNADPRIVGRQIRLDGLPNTIVGVLPPGFRLLSSEAGIYTPLTSGPQDRGPRQRHSGGNNTHMIARLHPGVSVAGAQAQIDAHNATVEGDTAQSKSMADAGFRSVVASLHGDHVASIRPTLLLLQAGVLVLLLIGVVNLVNLLLIRASGRVKELALRQALGASRRHVLSEVMIETALLALLGGLLGSAAGAAGTSLLSALGADRLPLGADIAFDLRTGFVALAASIAIGIVLAVPIAWFSIRGSMGNALQSENRGGTASRAVQHLRHGFIAAQISLAFILLAGASLLAISLNQAMAVSPGFQFGNILTGQISMHWSGYQTGAARLAFTENLMKEMGGQPGVVAAGFVTNVPFSGHAGKSAAKVKGHILRPGESPRGHYSYGVAGDYFSAMGFSLQAGRFLSAADSRRAERVCVVDEDFARHYWPGGGALGRLLFQGGEEKNDAEAFTVVGVVGRVMQAGLTDEARQGAVYYPYIFRPDSGVFFVARTGLTPEALALTLQKLVRQIDADLPVNDIRSMGTRIAVSLIPRRSSALLAGLFSVIAVLLTAIGTYGVLSYTVAQRRREIGVRMALGARPEQIRRQYFVLALRLLGYGTAVGLIGAWFVGQAMQSILFRVPALNATALAGPAAVLGVVSLAACLLPSHRAARISPMEALAGE